MDICPEDLLKVLMPAKLIPDGSTVSKRTGDYTSTLKHALKVYSDERGQAPLVVDGVFP